MAQLQTLLGIDIGGTKIAFIVGDDSGHVIERSQIISRPERGYAAMLADIQNSAARLIAKYPAITAVGVSVGGPLDAERGIVLGPPHLPGWNGVTLADDLAPLGVPVRIEHDAKAGALAEWRFGAGKDTADMVFLTLGTGIGAGIISGGKLLRGALNGAGEIGHWRMAETGPDFYGKPGSLEGLASGAGIAAYARQLHPHYLGDADTAKALNARLLAGDEHALNAVQQSGKILGRAIAMMIDLLAPERIVLGSLAQRLGAPFTDAMHLAIIDETLPVLLARCDIVNGKLGDRIGDFAALSVALDARNATSSIN